ncbi:hypothetical protein Tco_1448544 [Tanacetum coccineum]
MGLWYSKDSGIELIAYSDADHVGCKDDCKSTSGGLQFLGGKLVSYSSKKQDCTAMSAAEAEYVSLSACCAQVIWMRTQLLDYGYKYNRIPMYCDSKSAIAISCNPVQHSKTKHIDIWYHFIKEHVEKVIIMTQQQHAAEVHPDELCPPNKRYDLMDANKKVDLEHLLPPYHGFIYFSLLHIVISLLLTPLCCDDTHEVTPRVSAMAGCDNCALSSYACSDSLLLTPLCCDDIHEVTPRVSALAGRDRLVSEISYREVEVSLGTIFLIGLKCYRDPKEEPIGKEPLMELKEIGISLMEHPFCVILEWFKMYNVLYVLICALSLRGSLGNGVGGGVYPELKEAAVVRRTMCFGLRWWRSVVVFKKGRCGWRG